MDLLSIPILALNLFAVLAALFVIVRLRLKRREQGRRSRQDHEDSGQ